jgi:hypothetical protein
MKLIQIMAMVVIAIGARADQVTVYVQNPSVVPSLALSQAQVLANEIFAAAGLKIDWHRYTASPSQSRREGSILVEVCTKTPRHRLPGALAFAVPDAGGHITVFYDRIKEAAQIEFWDVSLLAHVFVHEIAHILEGSEKHSDGGVMKATWSQKDITSMRWRPLVFSQEDVEAIKAGLAERADAESPVSVYPAP